MTEQEQRKADIEALERLVNHDDLYPVRGALERAIAALRFVEEHGERTLELILQEDEFRDRDEALVKALAACRQPHPVEGKKKP